MDYGHLGGAYLVKPKSRRGLRVGDLVYPRWWWDDGEFHRADFPRSTDGRPTPGLVLDVLVLDYIDRHVAIVFTPMGNVMTLLVEDAVLYNPPEEESDE